MLYYTSNRIKIIIINIVGDHWHRRRKLLTPAFHFNVLKKYLEVMNERSIQHVENLKNDRKKIKDLVLFYSDYTLEVICGKFV